MKTVAHWRLLAVICVAAALGGCKKDNENDAPAEPERAAIPALAPAAAPPPPPHYHPAPPRPVQPPPPREVAVAPCTDCGTVSAIEEVQVKGDGTGAGAVMGAAIGAVIGHQIGSGRGNDAATATGAIAGGVAGHQIERRMRGEAHYRVLVSMETGGQRTVEVATLNGVTVGSKVRVVGPNLELRS